MYIDVSLSNVCSCFNQVFFFLEVKVTLLICYCDPRVWLSPLTDLKTLLAVLIVPSRSLQKQQSEKMRLLREFTPLTCTWSSSMPAAIIASPASRYGGSTWRQIPLEDSVVGRCSLIFSIFTTELLGRTSMSAPLSCLCSFEPKCCQLKDPDTVCLCQPALCRSASFHITHRYQVYVLMTKPFFSSS